MVQVTGLYTLGNSTIMAEYVKVDYPNTLALYTIRISISVKSFQRVIYSREFIIAKMRRIARLVRILGIDSIVEVFGSKVTLSMLRPLRSQRLCCSILKKPSIVNHRRPNNGNFKYGIRVPINVKEAAQFDKDSRNTLWENDIHKELKSLMTMSVFKKLPSSMCKSKARGYQFAPL